jgi:hypothetical protein
MICFTKYEIFSRVLFVVRNDSARKNASSDPMRLRFILVRTKVALSVVVNG